MKPNLWLIIPCYNEQEIIHRTMNVLSQKLHEMIRLEVISADSQIMLVDDGSKDQTWTLIKKRCEVDQMFRGIKLSRNFGQQSALLAGMHYACGKCDCIISMDADLQDDVSVLSDFVDKFQMGYQVIYGVRNDRRTDTWFKKNTAALFYRLMSWLNTKTVEGHSECRLLSDKALRALQEYTEINPFLRGIVPLLGFDSTVVYYARQERTAGETKYPIWKLVRLALDGIMSSSEKPLRLIPLLGVLCLCFGIAGVPYNSWVSSGLQLLCLGIVGSYTSKVYTQVKRRPRYIISEIIGGDAL